MTFEPSVHNASTYTNHGCRCDICRADATRVSREYRARKRTRRRDATPEARARHRRLVRDSRRRYPERVRAWDAVKRAVKKGLLVRPDRCSRCGASGRIEASHDDYSRPLDVEWLCKLCHARKDALARRSSPAEQVVLYGEVVNEEAGDG